MEPLPLLIIFEGRNLSQQTNYISLEREFIEEYRYRQNILIRDFMSNFREMTPQRLRNGSRKKFQTFKI